MIKKLTLMRIFGTECNEQPDYNLKSVLVVTQLKTKNNDKMLSRAHGKFNCVRLVKTKCANCILLTKVSP